MAEGALAETPQRWTARRRATLVLSLLRGEASAAEGARKHGPTVAQVEEWWELVLAGAENGWRSRPRDQDGLKDEPIKQLRQKVGEFVLDIDVLNEATRGRPFGPRASGE